MQYGISCTRPRGDDFYKKLKSFGFDCYDFKMTGTENPPYIYDDRGFEDFLKNQKKLAHEAGVTINQAHGPWRYPVFDSTPEERAERLEKMTRSIHGAAILEAKYWVIHPIMPFGTKDLLTDHVSEARQINLEFMYKLLQIGKREGVTVCLENMPYTDLSISSPTSVAEFVREMNDPYFAMCLDTGHANKKTDWLTPANTVRKYSDIVKVLHVHDNRGSRDEHLLPFFGTVDWLDLSKALHETGFNGVFSLECAPSAALPHDILEDMYLIYFRTAKAAYECCITL